MAPQVPESEGKELVGHTLVSVIKKIDYRGKK